MSGNSRPADGISAADLPADPLEVGLAEAQLAQLAPPGALAAELGQC